MSWDPGRGLSLEAPGWPMHTGQLEGINNKIKLIKRQAFNYRDTDCFFLKIKAAFPGNA